MPSPHDNVGEGIMFSGYPSALNNFDKTVTKYSLALTDDLIRFLRSKVKVTARGGKNFHVNDWTSKSIF